MAGYTSSPQFVKITAKLRQTGYLSDATIILDDNTRYDIHKVILAAHSDYFRALFTYDENESGEFRLLGIPRDTFEPILNWIYKHQLRLTRASVRKILGTAHYLDCGEVIGRCVAFIKSDLSVANALGYKEFVRANNILELVQYCSRYVSYNFVGISQVQQGEFLDLSLDDLCELLEAENLNANEQSVWFAAMRWVENDVCRSPHLSRIITKIRMGQFTEDFFSQIKEQLTPFRPLSNEAETLIDSAEEYFDTLRNVSSITTVIGTPTFALPRLSQSVVLAFGGWTGGHACNLLESYDIRADRWTAMPHHDPLGERGYLGAAVIGTKVYLVGGTNGEKHFNATSCFDVETATFNVLNPMHTCRCYICLTSIDGDVYAIGGFNGAKRLKSVERYEPEKNQWTLVESMANERSDAGCASLDGKIYVVGGFDGVTQLDSVEVYNPKTDKWNSIEKMSTPRSGVSCVAFKGELYVLGGFDGNQRLSSCEKYNPRKKKWTNLADMMTTRSNFSAAVIEDTIMVVGGFNGQTTSELVECFNPIQNCWCSSSDVNVHRSALSVCVIPGNLLSEESLGMYSYPNRKYLPEEKRLYERGLVNPLFEADETDSLDGIDEGTDENQIADASSEDGEGGGVDDNVEMEV